ncbi:MAG: tetratricopeptide repeat protein [Okeania sp. SIO3B3]|nr:tetratricopeptide repeat protein [Okeania sp. SIO3B3]
MNQESLTTLIRKGNKLKREGDRETAIATYRRCIEINPNSAWSYHYLGEVWFELGNWQEAVGAFSKAVELNQSSGWSYHKLGEALFKLGDLNRAETNLRQACELDPDNYQFYKVLAWLYKKRRRWNEAITYYSKVIELHPNDPMAYYWLTDIYRIKGELSNAITFCQQGLEKYPQDSQLTSQLATLTGEKKADTKKDRIIICAIFKNEAPYILEWIAYHKALKVDGFIIYDNYSTDGTTEILQGLEKAGIITYIKWPDIPGKNHQIVAYQDAVRRFKHKCEWIGFIDADEFILLNQHNDIQSFLDDYQDVDGIAINWKLFGSSGHVSFTDGLVIERFTKCTKLGGVGNERLKTIAKINSIREEDGAGVHTCQLKGDNPIYVYPDRTSLQAKIAKGKPHIDHSIAQINHYATKSKHEWNLKVAKGRALAPEDPGKKLPMHMFYKNEQKANIQEDLKIQRWVEDTRKELKVLRSFVELEELKAQLRFAKAILRESQLEMGPNAKKLLQTEQKLYQIKKELHTCQTALSQKDK